MRSERIVTTIGGIGYVYGDQRASSSRASHASAPVRKPAPKKRVVRRSTRFDDSLEGMMGIGDITLPPPEGTLPPSDLPPGTFDVPGSGEIVIPEVTITPGPSFTPSPVTSSPSSSSGNPPAATPSKAAWARGDGSYILQAGDTLFGLAATYLRSGGRWPEIWNLQPAGYTSSHTPDKIFAGEVLAMPKEAQANARAMGLFGIGANLLGRGFSKTQVALAAGGVVGLGTLIHFAMR